MGARLGVVNSRPAQYSPVEWGTVTSCASPPRSRAVRSMMVVLQQLLLAPASSLQWWFLGTLLFWCWIIPFMALPYNISTSRRITCFYYLSVNLVSVDVSSWLLCNANQAKPNPKQTNQTKQHIHHIRGSKTQRFTHCFAASESESEEEEEEESCATLFVWGGLGAPSRGAAHEEHHEGDAGAGTFRHRDPFGLRPVRRIRNRICAE